MEDEAISLEEGLPALPEDLIEPAPGGGTWDLFLGAGGVVLLAAALIFGWYRWKKGRSPREREGVPPRREAEEGLRAVQASIAERGTTEVAVELSRIMRRYVDRLWQTGLTHQTTQEHWEEAGEGFSMLPEEPAHRLARFLESCDALKYEGTEISRREKEDLVSLAVQLVRRFPTPSSGAPAEPARVSSS